MRISRPGNLRRGPHIEREFVASFPVLPRVKIVSADASPSKEEDMVFGCHCGVDCILVGDTLREARMKTLRSSLLSQVWFPAFRLTAPTHMKWKHTVTYRRFA